MSDEYRVAFRREGGKTQYRLFQRISIAARFIAKVEQDTRPELAPLVMLSFDVRECSPWRNLSHRDGKISERKAP